MKHLTNAELADWLDDDYQEYVRKSGSSISNLAEISERLRASAVPAEPVAEVYHGGTKQFGYASRFTRWLPAAEKLTIGTHLLYAAPEPRIAAEAAPVAAQSECKGEPGECHYNKACMYNCGGSSPAQPTSGKLSLADVGVTPQGTPQHMLDRAAQPLPVAAVALTDEQDELQTRLRSMAATLTNIASDPMWTNHAEISKRTLLRAAECLQIGLTAVEAAHKIGAKP